MADPNTRQGKRTPVTLKIKFKSETLEQFIERYAVDVSQGGIFIRTKEPLAVGTQMKFEFQLRDASPLIAGEGTVVWTRENDPSRPAIAPGMGVRFDRLAEGSQQVLERILAEKAKQAPHRGADAPTKPPLFTDTPTRVAPAPVQDALLNGPSLPRTRSDSEQTPLPKPMPFHSDADEFDDKAFEEATKVRALDELVAQTAEPSEPPDELALRRGGRSDSTLADPAAQAAALAEERDSAPGLPSPPAAERSGRALDTSPSPRAAEPKRPSQPPPVESAKTRLGVEPARAATPSKPPGAVEPTEKVFAPRAVVPLEGRPDAAPKRPSSAPIVIGILVVVAAAVAAVWFFAIKPGLDEKQAQTAQRPPATPGSGSAPVAPGSGSAAIASTGSGSAVQPAAATVDTAISANIGKASVEVIGTDQSGQTPFAAKLEKGKTYRARVFAPGYIAAEIDVTGGDQATAKLELKPRVISVTSEPAGAQIYVDGTGLGKVTPADVELTAAQAAKPKVKVMLRKPGYRVADQTLDASAFREDDAKLSTSVDLHLAAAVEVVVRHPPPPPPPPGPGSGSAAPTSGSGSATGSGSGSGSGSDTGSAGPVTNPDQVAPPAPPPSPPAPPPSTGSNASDTGSASKPSGGSGEPEPDWTKKQ